MVGFCVVLFLVYKLHKIFAEKVEDTDKEKEN